MRRTKAGRAQAVVAACVAAIALAACNPETYDAPVPPGPSASASPELLAHITSVGVTPETIVPDQTFQVITTYLPGSTYSIIPCEITEGGTLIYHWSDATDTATPGSDGSEEKVLTNEADMPDVGEYLVSCTSPDDDGVYQSPFSVTGGEDTPSGSASAPLLTPTPMLTPAPTAEPTPAPSIAFSGYGSGDLVFDLSSATTDLALYPKPADGCWPVNYHADATASLTISSTGTITGMCMLAEGPLGPGQITYLGGLTGTLDPTTGKVDFGLQAERSIDNKRGDFGYDTLYVVIFTGTGRLTSPTQATGTATWKAECRAGDFILCSNDSAFAHDFKAAGTINWTMTLTP